MDKLARRPLTKTNANLYMAKSLRHQYAATAGGRADWTVACWPITAHEGNPDGPTAIIGEHMPLRDADELVRKHIEAHS